MALTDSAIKTAKPREKPYKMGDAHGLYLLVNPSGSKLWRLKFRFDNKEKSLSFGAYPAVTLAQARQKRDEARQLLAQGVDPSAERRAAQLERRADSVTFEALAREWYEFRSAPSNLSRWCQQGPKFNKKPALCGLFAICTSLFKPM